VPRIIAVVDEVNAASLRVAARIGMTRLETIEAHGPAAVRSSIDNGRRRRQKSSLGELPVELGTRSILLS
jgi:RimJ/RimL family protein N-acetyltransferase